MSHNKDRQYACTCIERMGVCHMTKMGIMPVHDVGRIAVCDMTKIVIMPIHVLGEWMFVT